MAELTHDEVSLILSIVDGSSAVLISMEVDGLQVRISRGCHEPGFLDFASHSAQDDVLDGQIVVQPNSVGNAESVGEYDVVRAPLLGDFIVSQSPTSRPFVMPGDGIEAGALLALIEIAGIRHEIRAKEAGRIVEVLAENMAMVEYDQPLFLVDAASAA